MSIEQIANLVTWWRGLLARKEYKELRCRLHAPLLGERISPWRTCHRCEHNQVAVGAGRRVPIRTDRSEVPTV